MCFLSTVEGECDDVLLTVKKTHTDKQTDRAWRVLSGNKNTINGIRFGTVDGEEKEWKKRQR